jgi:hypothetical protein
LSQYDFLVLYPINPRTAAKYRQAFAPSRAKDDPTDAALLLELLRKYRDKLSSWNPDSDTLRQLRQLVESRRTLVGEKVRLTNRITAALKNYDPQVLSWFKDKDTQVFCEFVEQYPTLKAAQAPSEDESDTPGKAGGLMNVTAQRAGALPGDSGAVPRTGRSYPSYLALVYSVSPLPVRSQPWIRHSLLPKRIHR